MTNPLYEITHVDKRLADLVPPHLRGGLARYALYGTLPGAFLQAAIRNDFAETLARHDETPGLRYLALFLRNEMPAESWGSREKMDAWVKKGGMGKAVAA